MTVLLVPDSDTLTFEQMLSAVPRIELDLEAIRSLTAGEQAQIEIELRRWQDALRTNPLLAYVPAGEKHYWFHHLIRQRTKHRWIFGGNRAGKTTTAIVDDLIQMVPKNLVPPHLLQWKMHECPFYCRIVAPDLEKTVKPVLHQKLKEWCPPVLFKDGDFGKSWNDRSGALSLECGCRIDFLSYEQSINKFGGAALHRIHWDESPPELIRAESLMRLIDFDGDEIGSMTPLFGLDHVYRNVYKRRGEDFASGRPKMRAWRIGMRDNRRLTESAIDAALDEVKDPMDRKRREFGEFTELGGQVYPSFGLCRVTRPDDDEVKRILARCNTVCAIDPGAAYAGLTWHAFDGDNYDLVFDALKLEAPPGTEGISAGLIAAYLKARAERWGITPRYVIDPAATQRTNTTGTNVLTELANHGIHATLGNNEVTAGVWNIRDRLKAGSLRIYDDLECIFDEAIEYSIEQREDGIFSVVKRNDHVMDSLRYGCMERPWVKAKSNIIIPPGADVARPPMRKIKDSPPEGALV